MQTTEYNANAIHTAEALTELRASFKIPTDLPVEKRFAPHNRTGLGVALEYERMGNQPVTDELQGRADKFGFRFEHLGLTLGTVIHGIDLKQALSPELVSFVRQVLLERKVIFFRDQHLEEDEQVRFSRYFGELDAFPFGKPGENPYILEIIHDDRRPGTENGWHTDVTWMQAPSLGSVAQCVEVPPIGGDTLFSDSFACYLGMPEALQQAVEHLNAVHDYRVFVESPGRGQVPDELLADIKQRIPFGVDHPLLRTHPETGRTALYVHGGFLRHDSLYDRRTGEPLGREKSEQMVRELLAQHGRPETVCRFTWEAGSIAFWDNRAVQHYAASDYYPHRRVLRRVTISGDRPYYEPGPAG
jgi:taurine dioxygenase